MSAGEGERGATVKGAAAAAGVLLDKGPGEAEPDAGYGTVHGLFRLAAQLALTGGEEPEHRAVAMLVDDAQWADGPSLRFLAYLAERLADLPIALVVSMRLGEPGADAAGLAALRVAAADRLLRLRSLSSAAVKRLVTAAFPVPTRRSAWLALGSPAGTRSCCSSCWSTWRPTACRPAETTAERLGDLAPQAVLDTVVARLGTLAPAVRAVASAVAVLGDGTALRHVAALADLPSAKVAEAADTLAGMHLFCAGEPLSFVHPLIRQAVEQSISPLARGYQHARAAEILDGDGQSEELVAPHLLAAPTRADARTVEILRAAARKAMASGAVSSAVGLLSRGLDEGSKDAHGELLAELAQAEAQAGLPRALARLSEAIETSHDPHQRAELALTLGAAHYRERNYVDAVMVLAGAALDARHDDPQLAEEIAAAHFSAVSLVPGLAAETQRRGARLIGSLPEHPSPPERTAVAHLAVHRALQREPRGAVRRLADLAWGDGELLETDGFLRSSWSMVAAALHMVDDLERALELCRDAALAHAGAQGGGGRARRRQPLPGSWPLYERGEIAAAAKAAGRCHRLSAGERARLLPHRVRRDRLLPHPAGPAR